MPPKPAESKHAKQKGANTSTDKMAANNPNNQQAIPEHELKQNSGASASMALQAMQKAWDLRQAANAAGDPNAREEILAKAINKEIEAESFGKAAKYTQSGAFQGLAAGAGLGVQPGVTLGKITGAIVGGTVSTVTGLLGAGVGSVYGAMNGPMWDLGQMASQGVRGVVGDFPNWKSTPAQKKALEKMVMQTRETQAPSKEELEKMKADAPDDMPQTWSQTTKDMTSWRPSMPSMPSMPNMPNMPSMPSMPSMSKGGAALGLGGLGASMPSWGGQNKSQVQQEEPKQVHQGSQSQVQPPTQTQDQRPRPSSRQPSKQGGQTSQQVRKPKEAPVPKEPPKLNNTSNGNAQPSKPSKPKEAPKTEDASTKKKPTEPKAAPKPKEPATKEATKSKTSPPKQTSKPPAASKPSASDQPKQTPSTENKDNKTPAATNAEKKKPRKLAPKSSDTKPSPGSTVKRPPRKLEVRKAAA